MTDDRRFFYAPELSDQPECPLIFGHVVYVSFSGKVNQFAARCQPTPRVTLHMSVFPCQQREHRGELRAGEARERGGSEEQRVEEGGGGGVLWWLLDAFLGTFPEVTSIESCCRKTFHPFSFSVFQSSSVSTSEFLMSVGNYYRSFRENYRKIFCQIIRLIEGQGFFFTWVTHLIINHISCLLLLTLPHP